MISELFNQWLIEPSLPIELKQQLNKIQDDPAEVEERFYQFLSFGTGGMRGLLGAGTNRINIFTIRHVAEGLALLLKEQGQEAMDRGVVIAYDTRHLSKIFALETAKTIGKYGIRVLLFKESRPTPELSFAIRHYDTAAGVVITASHNPAAYNGIKVYGKDGGQLPPEAAEIIVAHMRKVTDLFSIQVADENELLHKRVLQYVLEDVDTAYQQALVTLREVEHLEDNLSIVYTPLHGSGLVPVVDGLRNFGFTQLSVVSEQQQPDPEFPTVAYPNPEERDAFELAIRLGHERNAEVLLATDPDADRLGVAIRDENGEYRLLSGNQLGALLLHYLLSQKKRKGTLPPDGVVLKTIVTSELGRAIAEKFNMQIVDTLTGFKFISEKIEEYRNAGTHTFLFGYEESYGYLIGDFVRDKDAVQAALLTAEMASFYKTCGKSLLDGLDDLYSEFGYFQESLHSITLTGKEGQEKIKQIMEAFRRDPQRFLRQTPARYIEDYKRRTRQWADGSLDSLSLPEADVIKLIGEDGSWVCIRPSGTEPKCKFYFGVDKPTAEEAKSTLHLLETDVMQNVNSAFS
ncbi:phospho-sugar mutase [Sporosarcina sp. 179-K 3D1 HS]|uniref:phospho-sugar mutase n=1 Tax=Sporosarcina sp. 179-K 3D1 HS TaxID=3232169 RepID=UPI0039A2A9B3